MSAVGSYTHYVSIDFGTSGCAIAIGFSNPEPKKIHVFSGWSQQIGIQVKYPTILLVDPHGSFVSFGEEALDGYQRLKGQAQDYYLFHRFKMKLYDDPVRHGLHTSIDSGVHYDTGKQYYALISIIITNEQCIYNPLARICPRGQSKGQSLSKLVYEIKINRF